MKKTGIIVLAILAAAAFWGIKTYNKLVKYDEQVQEKWGQVENVYQRRADLIPNLVNTVKGYAKHEEGTLTGVVEARAKATQMHVDAKDLNEESIKKFQEAQGELGQALGRLLAIQENYPELKANENFKELQAQLEGTENRISAERKLFNEFANKYNTYLRKFPANIIAGMFSFEKRPYFEAKEGADNAPTVSFE